MDIKEINERIQRESAFVDSMMMELSKVIVGQKYMTERLLIGLLANGHVLLEGVSWTCKNSGYQISFSAIQAKFSRIQHSWSSTCWLSRYNDL